MGPANDRRQGQRRPAATVRPPVRQRRFLRPSRRWNRTPSDAAPWAPSRSGRTVFDRTKPAGGRRNYEQDFRSVTTSPAADGQSRDTARLTAAGAGTAAVVRATCDDAARREPRSSGSEARLPDNPGDEPARDRCATQAAGTSSRGPPFFPPIQATDGPESYL